MTAVPISPPRPSRASAPRRLGAGGTVLVAVVLALALVIAPKGGRAEAFLNPLPILIGGSLAAAPAAQGAAVGGLCATGVGCLALGAIGLGITAYATRDSWMPWVSENILNLGETKTGTGASGCGITVTDPVINGIFVDFSWSTACPNWNGGTLDLKGGFENLRCVGSNGVEFVVTTSAVAWSLAIPNGGNKVGVGSANFSSWCGVGGTVRAVTYWVFSTGTGEVGASTKWILTAPVPDSAYKIDTSVDCKRPDGTTFTITGSETGHPERLPVPSCRAVEPSSVPSSFTATSPSEPSGSTPLVTWTAPDWQGEYPDCFGPSGLLCQIQVYVHGNPCEVGMETCERWWDHRGDPARGIQCRFGSYVVAFANCEPLKRSYRPNTATQEVVDAEPGWPNSDPETPVITDNPPTAGPNPTAPPVDPNPEVTDPDSNSCMGAAWSWNPVDWVYVPTKCALIWAFVPKTSLELRINTIKAAADGKAPFTWLSGIGDIPTAITGSCPDWRVKIPGQLDKNVVCDSSFTSAIRTARPVFLVFMASLALWPLIRSVMYGSIPIIRASAGKL